MEVETAASRLTDVAREEASLVDQEPQEKGGAAGGCFDCNICLDFSVDPVVTLCGHLYCWPCIYKWLQHSQDSSLQQCPVCKASLSQDTLVPLYGRGHSAKSPYQNLQIPHRPSVPREAMELQQSPRNNQDLHLPLPPYNELHHYQHHQQQQQQQSLHQLHDYSYLNSSVVHSMAGGVLGGMAVAILPWMFRNQDWASMYYSSPYYAVHGGNPRLRRQELEIGGVLHQIWLFLFFGVIICLLLF